LNFLDGIATVFEEYPDSPEIERSEQATITHRFICDEYTGGILISAYYRGVLLLDSYGNVTRVLSSKLNHKRANLYDLTITAEGVSFDPPPDEFSVETSELNPGLDKHPRYAQLSYAQRRLVKQNVNTDNLDLETSAFAALKANINTPGNNNNNQLPAAEELLNKYDKGEDSFYLPGFKIQWSTYFWAPQIMNPGGYIEDPISGGGLPFFFWDTNTDSNSTHNPDNSIFSQMAEINPNMYFGGISWLRQADTLTLQRTWYRLTRTWIGGPLGRWDAELYTVIPDGYNNIPPFGLAYSTGSNSGGLIL
jgi:hypothetical protein